jgi:sialic acid synthase SpsE
MKVQLTKDFEVSNFSKPYIIAEIGANHNGDMDLARKMILAAKEAGCHAAKFQSWTNESLVSREEYNRNQSYDDSPKKHFGSLEQMIEKYYLREDQHFELKEYCDSIGIDFCSSPFSIPEVDLLVRLDVPFLKVASMDINNYPLLKHIARTKKPVVLSTGMSTIAEIEQAVSLIRAEGNQQIVVLHCISIYPPENKDIHLRNITMLQQTFDLPIGFSDHTFGTSIPLASIALGACVIEKHFTLDKGLEGWDHEISADPNEMKVICRDGKIISQALGNFKRVVSDDEESKKLKFRRSIVAVGHIKAGTILTDAHLNYKRPGTGIPPNKYQDIIGRTVKTDLQDDQLIKIGDLN